ILLIGMGAGLVTALLYASVISGAAMAFVLMCLAPLPILIVALGWTHWSALVAAITASVLLGAMTGFSVFTLFLVSVALPAWWLGYLALLARPGADPETMEWYPVGRIVLWAAVCGAIGALVILLPSGFDIEAFYAKYRPLGEQFVRLLLEIPAETTLPAEINGIDTARLVQSMIATLLPSRAVLSAITLLINLWLAGRIAFLSKRLRRPWPEIALMTIPSYAFVLTALALLGTYLQGLPGAFASVVAYSLLTIYAILGLAVLHTVTRPLFGRGLILAFVYATIILIWPVVALLGLADTLFNFRRKFTARNEVRS
ncbi:MAG: DUF2232 domain-containing protein, partial [Pseudorhodoplanes sp.]